VQLYKQTHELTRDLPSEQQCKIALCFDQGCDHCHYNLPDATNNEIAVIIPGDGDQLESTHDIVLFHRHCPPLQHITNLHLLYPVGHDTGNPWVYFIVPIPVPMNTVPIWVGVWCLLWVSMDHHGYPQVLTQVHILIIYL
jgi:hypothetical protein